MKFLKRFFLTILVLVLIFVGIGFYLPDTAHVERSTTIEASPSQIFPHINDFKAFNEWQPWASKAADVEYIFEGPATGVGSKMIWKSENPQVGSGSQEIIESSPPNSLKTKLDFGEQGSAIAYFDIKAEGEVSHVTWGFDTDFGNNPINRYFGLMVDSWVGADYEQGLSDLKKLVEAN